MLKRQSSLPVTDRVVTYGACLSPGGGEEGQEQDGAPSQGPSPSILITFQNSASYYTSYLSSQGGKGRRTNTSSQKPGSEKKGEKRSDSIELEDIQRQPHHPIVIMNELPTPPPVKVPLIQKKSFGENMNEQTYMTYSNHYTQGPSVKLDQTHKQNKNPDYLPQHRQPDHLQQNRHPDHQQKYRPPDNIQQHRLPDPQQQSNRPIDHQQPPKSPDHQHQQHRPSDHQQQQHLSHTQTNHQQDRPYSPGPSVPPAPPEPPEAPIQPNRRASLIGDLPKRGSIKRRRDSVTNPPPSSPGCRCNSLPRGSSLRKEQNFLNSLKPSLVDIPQYTHLRNHEPSTSRQNFFESRSFSKQEPSIRRQATIETSLPQYLFPDSLDQRFTAQGPENSWTSTLPGNYRSHPTSTPRHSRSMPVLAEGDEVDGNEKCIESIEVPVLHMTQPKQDSTPMQDPTAHQDSPHLSIPNNETQKNSGINGGEPSSRRPSMFPAPRPSMLIDPSSDAEHHRLMQRLRDAEEGMEEWTPGNSNKQNWMSRNGKKPVQQRSVYVAEVWPSLVCILMAVLVTLVIYMLVSYLYYRNDSPTPNNKLKFPPGMPKYMYPPGYPGATGGYPTSNGGYPTSNGGYPYHPGHPWHYGMQPPYMPPPQPPGSTP